MLHHALQLPVHARLPQAVPRAPGATHDHLLEGRRRGALGGLRRSLRGGGRGARQPCRPRLQPQRLPGDRRGTRRARTLMTGATVTREVGEALATDYFLVRDQLTDEQYGRFIEMRRFVDREVLPVIAG